jgi:hypothetical protein
LYLALGAASSRRATSSVLSTTGILRGWRTTVRRRARSGRSSVVPKRKRSAETDPLITDAPRPSSVCLSWKRRKSSAVAVSGERPMKAAKLRTWRT